MRMRSERCERCPDEHTSRCETCNPEKPKDPEEITREKAINYFMEENKRYEDMLGDRVKQHEEYRMNALAIDALLKVIF